MVTPNYHSPPLEHDPDADWLMVAEVTPAQAFRNNAKAVQFIPSFPLSFLQRLLPAEDAIPLLLVAMAEMRMRFAKETSLGPSLWQRVGRPSRRVRARWLKQIAQLPRNVCELIPRKGRPYLLRQGADWPQPAGLSGSGGRQV